MDSDLLTALLLGAGVFAVILLFAFAVALSERHTKQVEQHRQQVLAREAELREIENGPSVRIDPILDGLPADIRHEFDP